jgi:mono/diheme cytochrome c family protein
MRHGWKVLAAALLTAACVGRLSAEEKKADPKADALVKRGEYLVNEVAHCGECHTPRDKKGDLDMTRHLQGAEIWFTPKVKPKEWEDKAPDITMSGVAGNWKDAELLKFFTTGINTEGEKPDAPMPVYKFSQDDAKAVIAYLKSLKGAPKEGEKKPEKKEGGR